MLVLFQTSTWCIILTGYTQARDTRYLVAMDAFNEIKLLAVMYHLMCFSQFVPDPDVRFNIGYSCAAMVVFGLATNMFQLFVNPIYLIKAYCRKRHFIRKAKKEVLKRKPQYNA